MPVEVLRPNLVQEAEDAGIVLDHPIPSTPTIVGTAATIWRDDNPASYVDLTYTFNSVSSPAASTPTRQDEAVASLDVLSVDSTRATLNSVRIEWTATNLTTNYPGHTSSNAGLDLIDATTYDPFYGYMSRWIGLGLINASNPNPQDTTFLPGTWGSGFRHPDTSASFASAEVLDFLASGNVYVQADVSDSGFTTGSYTASGRVLDIKITVDYTLIRRKAPPCQIYPRDDNLATGSGHIWPPPSSQQSGRPGGYY